MGRPRPTYVELQRQRFKCRQMLAEFCAVHNIGQLEITNKSNFASIMRFRKRFIRFAWDSGCGLTAIASVVKRDMSTVDYHVRGLRKKRRERLRMYDAARRVAPERVEHV
jgi:hypothetical protein